MPESARLVARQSLKASRRTGASILSVGAALPEQVVTTAEIAEGAGVDEEWILSRTGIRERRHARPDERLADFAVAAGQQAVERAGIDPTTIDLVLVGTLHPDQITPNVAPEVAHRLGLGGAGAADVGAACTAFLSALGLGTAWIESGRATNALIVGADVLSRHTDFTDRMTAGLFSDGAGAVVLGGTEKTHVGPVILRTDGEHLMTINGSWEESLFRMDGPEVFRQAVPRLAEVVGDAIEAAGLGLSDIDLFVLHQANQRITHAVARRLGLDLDRVVDTIGTLGNNSAATLPLALDAAYADGRLHDGATVALGSFGAGFTYGGAVVVWGGA